jgi:cell division protein FtsI/penicillin-binding protein 2
MANIRSAEKQRRQAEKAKVRNRAGVSRHRSALKKTRTAIAEGTTDLDRGRCAAGFAGSTLSPLQGAVLAATVSNRGVAMPPQLVQDPRRPAAHGKVVLSPEVAGALGKMMIQTVVAGTGRHAFGLRPASLKNVSVAGKTGSLSGKDPNLYRHFSWFIGFAPADDPKIAVAVVAVNGLKWRAKAPGIANTRLSLPLQAGNPVS